MYKLGLLKNINVITHVKVRFLVVFIYLLNYVILCAFNNILRKGKVFL